MSASAIIFYIISATILGAGLLAVTSRKIFRSAIWLLFCLLGIAALYFWLEMEFIAAVQIVVYVGGIVVLIIFSIFLTQQSGIAMARQPMRRIIPAVLAVIIGFSLTYLQISEGGFDNPKMDTPFISADQAVSDSLSAQDRFSVQKIGSLMLDTGKDGYVLPFEVISILLLAAMIGCIVIAMKTPDKKEVSS